MHFNSERLDRFGNKYQLKVFASYFGTTPEGAREVACRLLESGEVEDGELTSLRLFMALNLIRVYSCMDVHAGTFQVNWKNAQNAWVILKKISKLLPDFLEWPVDDEDSDVNEEFEDIDDEFDIEDQYNFVVFGDIDDEEDDDEDDDDAIPNLTDSTFEEDDDDDDAIPDLIDRRDETVDKPVDEEDKDYIFVEAKQIKETFILSVDGVHCRINEPNDPKFRKNPKHYSHKFRQAGYCYEVSNTQNLSGDVRHILLTLLLFTSQICLNLYKSKVAWVNGPFEASYNDRTIAKTQGLAHKVPNGKLIIGDKGYCSLDFVSTRNSLDCPAVKTLKKRALARHETFNKRLKDFKCLAERFRHGKAKFKVAFEACVVMAQINMDLGAPLFDTLCAGCNPEPATEA
jgi:DDE superfamily endonuclease